MLIKEIDYTATVNVLRGSNCTHGLSSRVDTMEIVLIVDEEGRINSSRNFISKLDNETDRVMLTAQLESLNEATGGRAAVLILREYQGEQCHVVVPVENVLRGDWTMKGGNYADCASGRLAGLMGLKMAPAPIAIHDRTEGR